MKKINTIHIEVLPVLGDNHRIDLTKKENVKKTKKTKQKE
uniref:Uncharacterized protein n=1 Tax=Rhizophora mucronata TaxID=61149 RepID=A0A2P2QJN6_RHIMU